MASDPPPAATGHGLAAFFFPLLQPMLRMNGQPAIRQQSFQRSRIAWDNGRNPTQALSLPRFARLAIY